MTADPRIYYDQFSTSYERRRGHGYHALLDELEAGTVQGLPSAKLLEAGCGTGLILDRLRSGRPQLFGIDLSTGMLTVARRRGHAVAQASIEQLPFADGTFDVVCSFKVLAHVPRIRPTLSELARVVRPGGMLAVDFYNRNSLRGLRWRVKRLFGGERTAADQREGQLFTRYDSLSDMISYLPDSVKLQGIHGAIVFAPMAMAFRVPGVSAVLTSLERRASRSTLASRAGFVILTLRRL